MSAKRLPSVQRCPPELEHARLLSGMASRLAILQLFEYKKTRDGAFIQLSSDERVQKAQVLTTSSGHSKKLMNTLLAKGSRAENQLTRHKCLVASAFFLRSAQLALFTRMSSQEASYGSTSPEPFL